VTEKERGPRPKVDQAARLVADLGTRFRWRGDQGDPFLADLTGWWADASLLSRLGPALAGLFAESAPTVVMGPQSRGSLLGSLVALHLGLGLVEVRKDPRQAGDSDRWLTARTPPDYQDRTLLLGVRRDLLRSGARVLFVDDWIDTGGQALGARNLVDQAQATWCGAAVIVDGLSDSRLRRELSVRSLVRKREL